MQFSNPLERLRQFYIDRQRRNTAEDHSAEHAFDNDLGYDDALFDLELRNYFRMEYGLAEPPSHVYPTLLAAIRAHERGLDTPETSRPVAAFVSVYRVLRTATAHRLVSGGIAAALLIAVLSSGSADFLRGTAVSLVREESNPTPTVQPVDKSAFELATQRDNRYVTHIATPASDPDFYDPAERRMPVRADAASGKSTPSRWQRMGGQ
jgi:hypothetical protein